MRTDRQRHAKKDTMGAEADNVDHNGMFGQDREILDGRWWGVDPEVERDGERMLR